LGILEEIRDQNAKIIALLEGGGATAVKTVAEPKAETAAQKKAREKAEAEAAKPTFTAEELRDKYLEVMAKHGDAVAKELISTAGYDKLAKLVADAPNWQKSWDLAEEKLAEAPAADDNGGL
jgi:hypothetical protein